MNSLLDNEVLAFRPALGRHWFTVGFSIPGLHPFFGICNPGVAARDPGIAPLFSGFVIPGVGARDPGIGTLFLGFVIPRVGTRDPGITPLFSGFVI